MTTKDKIFYTFVIVILFLSLLEVTSFYANMRTTLKMARIIDAFLFLSVSFGSILMLVIDVIEPKGSKTSTILLISSLFLLCLSKCYTLYMLLS